MSFGTALELPALWIGIVRVFSGNRSGFPLLISAVIGGRSVETTNGVDGMTSMGCSEPGSAIGVGTSWSCGSAISNSLGSGTGGTGVDGTCASVGGFDFAAM